MLRIIKKFFYNIYSTISFIIKVISAIINGFFLITLKLFSLIFNKFRFSISFKINFLYGIVYAVLNSILYSLTFGFFIWCYKNTVSPHPTFLENVSMYLPVLIMINILTLCIFSTLGKNIVRHMLRPLFDMTHQVKQITGNDLVARLNTSGAKDELKDLAITFNEMMDRIQSFVEQQKQFASDASHELRTPITIIQGYADMLNRWGKEDVKVLEESIQSITQEADSMKQLLEKLLFLSRSDKNTLKVDMQFIDLSMLCKDVLKETGFIDDEHKLISKIEENVTLHGDPALVKEVIRIFIDNALKYTPEGGTISLGCARTKKNIILSIKDSGCGIPKEHIPNLFNRFYRVDNARNKDTGGTGLGLAIAHQIIEIHSAKIFVNSQIDLGTEFIIFFPLPNSI